MGGRRRAKRRRREIKVASSSEDEESDSGSKKHVLLDELKKAPKLATNRVAVAKREIRGIGGPQEHNDATFIQRLARRKEILALMDATEDRQAEDIPFCCAVCTCSDERIQRVEGQEDLLEPGEGYLHHRRCCHGFYKDNREDYCIPYLAAMEIKNDLLCPDSSEDDNVVRSESEFEWVTKKEIKDRFERAKQQESKFYDDDEIEHAGDMLKLTCFAPSDYYNSTIYKPFKELLKQKQDNETEQQEGMVVVDMFAGIGTCVVVLKRLGIKIKKVIHVEHDKIASHVYRSNHDCSYYKKKLVEEEGIEQEERIEHVYFQSFETFERQKEDILKQHGPIDLIIGGPPCVDYCAVNARREGSEGEQGQFMLRFGRLIRTMERAQEMEFDGHRLFFLAENVKLRCKDKEAVLEAFGLDCDPIEFDAKYVSPTRRDRHFLTNIYSEALMNFDYEGPPSHSHPSSCLEKGFVLAEEIITKDRDATLSKAPCFMASSTRIDEKDTLRMYVFQPKKTNRKYVGRPMNIVERERMMGYPDGYVENAVRGLFQELMDDGLCKVDLAYVGDLSWRKELRSDLHTFAGNYHAFQDCEPYKFVSPVHRDDPIALKMAPPLVSKKATSKPSFFTAEEYSKHLIGNAYSVPVVELLLGSLRSLFPHQDYPRFNYRYWWEEVQSEETGNQGPEAHATNQNEALAGNVDGEPGTCSEQTWRIPRRCRFGAGAADDNRKPAARSITNIAACEPAVNGTLSLMALSSAAPSRSQEQEACPAADNYEAPARHIESEQGTSSEETWRIPRRQKVGAVAADDNRKPAARSINIITEALRRPPGIENPVACGDIADSRMEMKRTDSGYVPREYLI